MQTVDRNPKWGFRQIPKIMLEVLFLVVLFVSMIQAAEFNPTCSAGDLVVAISSANENGEAKVINLPTDCTISIDTINNTIDGNNGLPSITTDLTINGNGGTIERNSVSSLLFRIFHIASDATLTLNNITIKNGSEPGAEGGGVYNCGVLNLNSSTITQNDNDLGGGGIYANGAAVNIVNSTISNNSSSYGGGGIRQVSGILTITDSTIYGNNSSYGGGGININYGETVLILTRCYVMNNIAKTSGGGISGNEALGGSITIADSYIVNNQAGFYGFGGGGGISLNFSAAEFVSIENSAVSYNTSTGGGGGISHSNSYTPLSIDDCTISNNETNYSGGGLSSVTSGFAQITICNCTFSENHARSAGGAMHTNSLFLIADSFFTGNISGYENGSQGGGGAINFPSNDAEGSISDCSFTDNTAGLDGGGVHSYGTMYLTRCIFSNNIAPNGSGDDICIAGGTITSDNLILTGSLGHGIETGNVCNVDLMQYLSILHGAADLPIAFENIKQDTDGVNILRW